MKAAIAVPATLALVWRSYSHNSLTPLGILVATLTAVAHAIHPWNLPFVLLCVFFLAGTRVTKIKKDVKASLTLHSQGSSGGEGPRTHVQVLANSLMASVFTLLHAYQLSQRRKAVLSGQMPEGSFCFKWGSGDLLVIGIIANYAAVCADTFSSELGILSRSTPRLITSFNLRKVPPGTNGGVTVWGLVAGALGSLIIVTASLLFLPLCTDETDGKLFGGPAWSPSQKGMLAWGLVIWGALGSLLDSFLGGWLQRSVVDSRTGKIVEGEGGVRVLVSTDDNPQRFKKSTDVHAHILKGEGKDAVENVDASSAVKGEEASRGPYEPKDKHRKSTFGDHNPTRVVESGLDLLDNNDVNFLMAFTMSIGAVAIAGYYWGIPLQDILRA
ncbi:integral membrane protein DUF92-domain-containing protein [Pseudomassariella vexata]|uniref:Integral membrane protein DUF92-domain-containing protein n=1 Tax=Pseudomassariella vexata TaxID=1141098 RepID=A0A1Y2E184_9PEZI|nr:integral membrane protein DUF92-domain-containing protein [Pseudomassariella vexata]ORY65290.1 integral membrane protein DUF92-domain-containing protein [Pseudomassariella vexata]